MPSLATLQTVHLPNGYRDAEGRWQTEVLLRPWDPSDLEALAAVPAIPAVKTSALLGRCVLSSDRCAVGEEFARELSVGDREALLLRLRSLTLGERIDCLLECPACHEKMDLAVNSSELLLQSYENPTPSHRRSISAGGAQYEVCFRLPNGADQEAVTQLAARDVAAAARTLLVRCIESVDEHPVREVPEALASALSRLMAELDPQAQLMLALVCPACGHEFQSLFDVSTFVQREIEQARRRLYREVHLLASRYHWSEAEILGMSAEKRRMYIGFVSEEPARSWSTAS